MIEKNLNISACTIWDCLLIDNIYTFFDTVLVGNLHWGYYLINGV